MKVATIQNLGMKNSVNLCESCKFEQPSCEPEYLIYGDGVGDDNIVACDTYRPLAMKKNDDDDVSFRDGGYLNTSLKPSDDFMRKIMTEGAGV